MKVIEWCVPVILGFTTLTSALDGQPYTAIVTGSCAGFVLGLLVARQFYRP